MNISINSMKTCLLREYWEYRNLILNLPLGLGALTVLLALVMVVVTHNLTDHAGVNISMDGATILEPDMPAYTEEGHIRTPSMGLIGGFITLGWLTAMYYLLGSLINDRKDKSILFWKSMPVSETQNVLAKVLTACLVFTGVAAAVAWITWLLALIIVAIGGMPPGEEMLGGIGFFATLMELILFPIITIVVGMLWGAPVFAWLLFASAVAKRSPFFWAVIPLFVALVVERALFSSSYIVVFFFSHMPFAVFDAVGSNFSLGGLLNHYLIENGLSFFAGLIIAAALGWAAIWLRDNQFET